MKRKKSTVDHRRQKLLDLLRHSQKEHLDIDELAARLDVSPVTLRRDLLALQDEGQILRSYGKVELVNPTTESSDSLLRQCRERIARRAASLVEDGDTIFINTSSTALRMVEHISAKNVTVITNNSGAIYCSHNPDVSIILTGGEVRFPKHAMVGDFTLRNLQPVYANKSFVGCSGLSAQGGMTSRSANEVSINILMLTQVTGAAYVLADHTKLGFNSSFTSAEIHKITNVITDSMANEEHVNTLRDLGINLFIA